MSLTDFCRLNPPSNFQAQKAFYIIFKARKFVTLHQTLAKCRFSRINMVHANNDLPHIRRYVCSLPCVPAKISIVSESISNLNFLIWFQFSLII